jgi:predicted transcriptional regulator
MPEERTVSFEDPADLLRLLTASRLEVFRSVKGEPGSITVIAGRLQRDRSAVKRDVDQLAQVGLVTIETKPLPPEFDSLSQEIRPHSNRNKDLGRFF